MRYVIAVLIIILITVIAESVYMFWVSIKRHKNQGNCWTDEYRKSSSLTDEENERVRTAMEKAKQLEWEQIDIVSRDGLRLHGRLCENPKGRGTIIMVHGYRSGGLRDFACAFEPYYSMGFSLFAVDQRACCDSEGKYLTFGYFERYDIIDWARYISGRYPGRPIVMDGISMGSATVMMACGEGYPEEVRCIVADCGYTTPEAICKLVMKKAFHVPAFPVFYVAKLITRIVAGFDLNGVSSTEGLKKINGTDMKVLIVHGKKDGFVPYYMSEENMAAFDKKNIGSQVVFMTSENARHGTSYLADPDKYTEELTDMFERAQI